MKYLKTFEDEIHKKPNYKIGDKVICIDDSDADNIVEGETYIVSNLESSRYGSWFCKVIGSSLNYYADRFVKDIDLAIKKYNI